MERSKAFKSPILKSPILRDDVCFSSKLNWKRPYFNNCFSNFFEYICTVSCFTRGNWASQLLTVPYLAECVFELTELDWVWHGSFSAGYLPSAKSRLKKHFHEITSFGIAINTSLVIKSNARRTHKNIPLLVPAWPLVTRYWGPHLQLQSAKEPSAEAGNPSILRAFTRLMREYISTYVPGMMPWSTSSPRARRSESLLSRAANTTKHHGQNPERYYEARSFNTHAKYVCASEVKLPTFLVCHDLFVWQARRNFTK